MMMIMMMMMIIIIIMMMIYFTVSSADNNFLINIMVCCLCSLFNNLQLGSNYLMVYGKLIIPKIGSVIRRPCHVRKFEHSHKVY